MILLFNKISAFPPPLGFPKAHRLQILLFGMMNVTVGFFIQSKQQLLREGDLPDHVWALTSKQTSRSWRMSSYVQNRRNVTVYLPLSLCSSDLLVKIPTHWHQNHRIIRWVLQDKFTGKIWHKSTGHTWNLPSAGLQHVLHVQGAVLCKTD